MLGLIRQEERRSGAGVRIRDYCGPVEFLNGGIDQIRHENGYIYLDRDLTEEHLYLTGTETVNKTYESISTVSERTIPNPRVIDYINEEGIILIPGFDVQDGATFLADIDTFPVTGLIYRYFIKDHLGSVRVEFEDVSGVATLKSQHHYYPFGCEHQGSWNQDTRNSHLYTGQERQDGFGLEYLRYGARFGDPLVNGRFDAVDRFSEKFAFQSPYLQSANNPIKYIDINGDSTRIYDLSGQYQTTINDAAPNEDHFIDTDAFSFINNTSLSDVKKAAWVRAISNYFIGANTRSQIKTIVDKTNLKSDGRERAFGLVVSDSRELSALDITDYAANRSSTSIDLEGALKGSGLIENAIGAGHTHPDVGSEYGDFSLPSQLQSRTDMRDYQAFIINQNTGQYGGNPAIIGSSKGLTIYKTGSRSITSSIYNQYQGKKSVLINFQGERKR